MLDVRRHGLCRKSAYVDMLCKFTSIGCLTSPGTGTEFMPVLLTMVIFSSLHLTIILTSTMHDLQRFARPHGVHRKKQSGWK